MMIAAKTSLRDRVYRALKEDIVTVRLRPGQQLNPAELARRFGVSKTPVREALHALQREGLIHIIPRAGYFVTPVTIEDVRNIFQLRLILEAASAQLAAQSITEEELDALEELSSRYKSGDVESYRRFLAENKEFHLRVARATGNDLLVEVLSTLLDKMQRLLFMRLDSQNSADEMIEEHRQLIRALRQRDEIGAREAMTKALQRARDAVLQSIANGEFRSVPEGLRL